ncbi:hypothetical protein BX600DRAFT_437358 [Xylariales sp. PMI_506]|nr:hypothetical protein BX600DRAFT_437358 [Xylariales sp. PMI_506]
MAASHSLQGTTILVTGGAGGLGKAIASKYLAAGANVSICDVHAERLSATEAELSAATPGHVLAVQTDITDEEAVNKLVSETVAKFGKLDILVNNAGISDTFNPVGELDKAQWDRVLNINLTGSFLCMKAAVNAMVAQGHGGVIIQIGSNASYLGNFAGAAYTVSKHGVAALVRSTACFYADKGISSVGLMLGAMLETNISESITAQGGINHAALAKTAGFTLNPETDGVKIDDVAKYCVFLSDPSIAATANGSCISFNKNWPKA